MSYFIHNAVVGTDADKPDPANPTGGAIDPAYPLYIASDVGKIYASTGKAWVQIEVIGGGGAITDATTSAIGGVEVDHARSGSHSVALTTDGLALPAGMIGTTSSKAAAGNDERLSDARTPTAHAATHVGAGGDVVYPGVTGDGLTPAGLTVAGGVTAGDRNAAVSPSFSTLYGSINLLDTVGNAVDSDNVLAIAQGAALPAGSNNPAALDVSRNGSIAAADYVQATAQIRDLTASARPVLHLEKQGVTVLEISTLKSITGALSAVTDPAAKAVLTSLVALATGIKVASDNTT